jgi:hypothetical protein
MCNAVFLAALLTILVGGLTLLRCIRGKSPNARLMIHALTQIEGPDSATGETSAPRDTSHTGPRPGPAGQPHLEIA